MSEAEKSHALVLYEKPKKKLGRPSKYSPDLAAQICNLIAQGNSLRKICRQENMPDMKTVFTWMPLFPDFLQQYTRAYEQRAEHLFEQILEIADDSTNDYIETEHGIVFNQENYQRSRLRVDSRKWFLARMNPKKYGDKQNVEVSGTVTLEALVKASQAKLEPQTIDADAIETKDD